MNILLVEPGQKPHAQEIENTLEQMQALVGGLIQILYPFDDPEVALVCNDEGKLLGLPLNRVLRQSTGKIYDVVAGTFLSLPGPGRQRPTGQPDRGTDGPLLPTLPVSGAVSPPRQ